MKISKKRPIFKIKEAEDWMWMADMKNSLNKNMN